MAKIEGRFQKELEVKTPLRLEVGTGSGDIEVQGGEDGKLRVSAVFEVQGVSQGEAEELARRIEEDPPIVVEGDVVRVGELSKYGLGRRPLGPSAVFDFSLSAPLETEARLSSGSGDQEVRGLKGPVIAKAGSGDVQIEDIEGEADGALGSGESGGPGGRARGRADVGRGDIDLRGITGRVSLRAGSGEVALHELGGSTDVSIGRGDISLESPVADGAEWVFKVGSGDVSLLLPSDSRFKLRAV